MRKHHRKSAPATSLRNAFDRNTAAADANRRPAKVMADLMGVELKTYYRWLSDMSMPVNRVLQFEEFCGAHQISEFLSVADGSRIVIDVPTGRRPTIADLSALQSAFADAAAVLCRYYTTGEEQAHAIGALTHAMIQAAFHRANVAKDQAPELPFDDVEAE
ncbi:MULTISPECIES: hypothetical protein [Burkholderia]|uniref:hypothetical protein n=1 Tax=Burkholderia TaxID=32008 RepID=UPI000555A9AF|nr:MULTISPECIES: hypothetical protein [Burkholderia]AOJ13179.1 hypothetical protein WJ02_06050 [Burkholderia vietnamiensis]HDR9256380.1 hypothetical protein [Burkholderia vietnamiensis]